MSPGRNTPGLVVLDKDGVLLDFAALWVAVTERRIRLIRACAGSRAPDADELGTWLGLRVTGKPCPVGRLVRQPGSRTLAELSDWLGERGVAEDRLARLPEVFRQAFASLPDDAYRVLPGAAEAMRQLQDAGWTLAVATSDTRAHALESLARAGLSPLPSLLVGGDEVRQAKPAPDLLLEACRRAGVAAYRTLAIGDTPGDLEMARAGGAARAYAVTCGVATADELGPLATAVFPDLAAAAGHILAHGLS
ncbi:MAG: HAD family hydrolase [Candidatus Sericytochromatia bacterium]|nr:HAD family hydrolase [Candidatus Sericytochromatia bacterium]